VCSSDLNSVYICLFTERTKIRVLEKWSIISVNYGLVIPIGSEVIVYTVYYEYYAEYEPN